MLDNKKTSLTNQIFNIIEENILNGVYPKGSILDEDKLSLELIVGKSTIREVLVKLETERLIAETTAGYVVLGVMEEDIKDIFYIKKAVEVVTAGLAAERISKEGLERLRKIVEEQEKHVEDGNAEQIRNMDTNFHDIIYSECGSPTYEIILSPIHHKLARYRKASLENHERILASVKEHRAIFSAIEAGNKDEAENLMMIHIEHAYAGILNSGESK